MDQEQILNIDENKEYICYICNTLLSSKRNLEWHILNVCQFNHCCDKCNQTFSSNNYLVVHQKKCVGIFKCHKCSKILSRKQTYRNHIEKCNKKCTQIINPQ